MDIVIIILEIVIVALMLIALAKLFASKHENSSDRDKTAEYIRNVLNQSERNMKADIAENVRNMGNSIANLQKQSSESQYSKLNDIDYQLNQKINDFREQMNREVSALKNDTSAKLDSIRKTVDEQLQNALDEKMNTFGQMLSNNQKQASDAQDKHIQEMSSKIDQNLNNMNAAISDKQRAET